MTNTDVAGPAENLRTVQVYRVYIKATPEQIWDAITSPEWSARYGYGGTVDYDLRPGGSYRALASAEMRQAGAPEVAIDGEVIECDPPRRLVQTWRMLMDEVTTAQGFTRLTFEIEPGGYGGTKLTVTHDLTGATQLQQLMAGDLEQYGAGGGWAWVLSDLKTVLETGSSIAG